MRLLAIILRKLGRSPAPAPAPAPAATPAPARPSLEELRVEQDRALAVRRADRAARQARARKGHATRWTAQLRALTAVNFNGPEQQNGSAEQRSASACHPKSDPRATDVAGFPADAHQKRSA